MSSLLTYLSNKPQLVICSSNVIMHYAVTLLCSNAIMQYAVFIVLLSINWGFIIFRNKHR